MNFSMIMRHQSQRSKSISFMHLFFQTDETDIYAGKLISVQLF